jgi:serine-threonine kinase receptor-associated protein
MLPSQQQQQPISQRKTSIQYPKQMAKSLHSKVWDTYTGECLHTLQHAHIVRSVAFPIQANPQALATGGAEKKLRIFDLTRGGGSAPPPSATNTSTENGVSSYEIGAGVHGGTIKSIVWNQDYNIITTAAEDRKVRWWDLRSRHPIFELGVDGPIGSCELNSLATRPNDSGILTVAAGKSVYLYDGVQPGRMLKKVDFDYEVASAAVNSESGRLVTGSANDTWARVYDLNTNEELGMYLRGWCAVDELVGLC